MWLSPRTVVSSALRCRVDEQLGRVRRVRLGRKTLGGRVAEVTSHNVLRKIATATRREHADFDLGVWLASTSARSLDDLREQAVVDRLTFAYDFLATANKLYSSRPQQNRSAISRYYYSMYHALRAAAFYSHRGDDYESHSSLPSKLPDDFPAKQYWANSLKSARENRNSADYDPYPVKGITWRTMATDLRGEAPRVLTAVEQYLKSKGCGPL